MCSFNNISWYGAEVSRHTYLIARCSSSPKAKLLCVGVCAFIVLQIMIRDPEHYKQRWAGDPFIRVSSLPWKFLKKKKRKEIRFLPIPLDDHITSLSQARIFTSVWTSGSQPVGCDPFGVAYRTSCNLIFTLWFITVANITFHNSYEMATKFYSRGSPQQEELY